MWSPWEHTYVPSKKKRPNVAVSQSNVPQTINHSSSFAFAPISSYHLQQAGSSNNRNGSVLSYNGISKNEQASSTPPNRGGYFSTNSLQNNGQENFSRFSNGQNFNGNQQPQQYKRFSSANSTTLNQNNRSINQTITNSGGLFSSSIVNNQPQQQNYIERRAMPVTISPYGSSIFPLNLQPIKRTQLVNKYVIPNTSRSRNFVQNTTANKKSINGNNSNSSSFLSSTDSMASNDSPIHTNPMIFPTNLENNLSSSSSSNISQISIAQKPIEIVQQKELPINLETKKFSNKIPADLDYGSGAKRDLYECARFIPIQEVWRMERRRKNAEILNKFECSRLIDYRDWRLHKNKQKQREYRKLQQKQSPTVDPKQTTKSSGLAENVPEGDIICVEDMLAEEKFDDIAPYLYSTSGILAKTITPKKYKKSLLKKDEKKLKKESHKKKILKSAKRKLLRKPEIQQTTPNCLKKKRFVQRTPEQEQEILYLFEKEGLNDEHYRYLHYAWNIKMRREDRPKIPNFRMDLAEISTTTTTTTSANSEFSTIFANPKISTQIQTSPRSSSTLPNIAIEEALPETATNSIAFKLENGINPAQSAFINPQKSIEKSVAINEEELRPESILLEFAQRAVYGPMRSSDPFFDYSNSSSIGYSHKSIDYPPPNPSPKNSQKSSADEVIKLEDVFAENIPKPQIFAPLEIAFPANEQFSPNRRNLENEKCQQFLEVPWVSPKKIAFQNPISHKETFPPLKFTNETFEQFCYADPQLNDLIPLPAGCARNQGYFKPSNKRRIMDHRIRRLKFISENRYTSAAASSSVNLPISSTLDSHGTIPVGSSELVMDDRQVKHRFLAPLSVVGKSVEIRLAANADKLLLQTSTPNNMASTMHLQHLSHRSATSPADSQLEPLRKAVFEKFRQKELKFCRSSIHGWGLYANETIGPDEVIIEYVGEKVRHSIADVREHKYEKNGIGSSYMFRIDDELVIDATYCGNYARFINHCCRPNCYAKIVTLSGNDKRIFIYSKNRIEKGEELTYDYKFEREEDARRVPCFCYTKGCRKYLN